MLVNSISQSIRHWLNKPTKNGFIQIIEAVKKAWNELFTSHSSDSTRLKSKTVSLIKTCKSDKQNIELIKQALEQAQAVRNTLSNFSQDNIGTDFQNLRDQSAKAEAKMKADPQGGYGVFLQKFPQYLSNKLRNQLIEILSKIEAENIFSDLLHSSSIEQPLKTSAQRFKDELETLRVNLEYSKDTVITEEQFKAYCALTHNQSSFVKLVRSALEKLTVEPTAEVALPIILISNADILE